MNKKNKDKDLIEDLEKLLDKKDKLEEIESRRLIPAVTAYNAHNYSIQEISPKASELIDEDDIKKETEKYVDKFQELQRILYAQAKYGLLIVLQGMDAAGKDNTVRKIFTGVNPLGCQVHSFKAPTDEELAHDFLWRIHQHIPQKGMIEIFNRSHYEDILVPTVEKLLPKEIIEKRFNDINNFEQMLNNENIIVLKFYLHISHKKQIEKLKERMEEPEKFRKHNDGDWNSSEKFDKYLEVYDEIFNKCSVTPWHIIPSNDKWYKIYLIAKTIVETLEQLDLKWPKLETEIE